MTHVQVIDDSSSLRQLVRAMLEPEGYTVAEAENGAEGLERLRAAEQPMVVLLDYQMPVLDGAGVLTAVSADGGALLGHEYIVISANTSTFPESFIELLRSLSIRILPKPFDHAALVTVVSQAKERLDAPRFETAPWETAGEDE
ncbi:MAG: hypothetical protein OJF49_003426 [Ktedonobacterales bacterium]|jgi:CheY-like chemotaxis protein|nr:MAG: hypothetical protein OJF49_003426 [Ktedonobacterales bacterium]